MKFLVFLLTVVALTWCVGAQIDCGTSTGCMCEGDDNVNKTLITCRALGGFMQIYLGNKGITSVNANAFEFNFALTGLDLGSNEITAIPFGFLANNTKLTDLGLYNNDISAIPDDFLELNTRLTILYLYNNQISTIPAGFLDKNTLLTQLFLYDNDISTIPGGFLELNTLLTKLALMGNQISTIPPGFLELNTALTYLDLYENQISTIPPGFLDNNTELTYLFLQDNPWDCSDCNVKDLGNKSAYNDFKTLDSNAYIAYCSNNASLGDIADAASYSNCTYPTTTTTTTTTTITITSTLTSPTISTADLSNTYSMSFVLVYSSMILSDWNQTFLDKVTDQIATAMTVKSYNVVLAPVTEVQANRRRSVRRSSLGTELKGTVTGFLTETAAFEGANTLRAIAPNLGADPNPPTTVTTFDGVLVPTPKHNDTNDLSTTEIILIAVGGVVFSALVGFAIYKWSSVCRKSMGYTYVFQA